MDLIALGKESNLADNGVWSGEVEALAIEHLV